jgi:hypothetical protein
VRETQVVKGEETECVYEAGKCRSAVVCVEGMVHVYNKRSVCSSDQCHQFSSVECTTHRSCVPVTGDASGGGEGGGGEGGGGGGEGGGLVNGGAMECRTFSCADFATVAECENASVCGVIGGSCAANPCVGSDICDSEVCVSKYVNNRTECLLSPCARYDEGACVERHSLRCDLSVSPSSSAATCVGHGCSHFNTRFFVVEGGGGCKYN